MPCCLHVKNLFNRFRKQVAALLSLQRAAMFRLYPALHTFPAAVKRRYPRCNINPSFSYNLLLDIVEHVLEKEKFQDREGVIGSRKSKNRQCNLRNKLYYNLQNFTQKTKDRATQTLLKSVGEYAYNIGLWWLSNEQSSIN